MRVRSPIVLIGLLAVPALAQVEGEQAPLTTGPWAWIEEARLAASDGTDGDGFGVALSIDGGTALVGAPHDDHGGYSSVGSAYVFVRSGAGWSQQAKLVPADHGTGYLFGSSVCLSGDTALIGTPGDDQAANIAGAAYVFVRSGTTWSQQAKLIAWDAGETDEFGTSVAIAGDVVLIAAPRADLPPLGDAGAVYAFVRYGSLWYSEFKLTADDAVSGHRFGLSVSLSGTFALIGTPYATHGGLGGAGACYVFEHTGWLPAWTQRAKLTASDAEPLDYFGVSVSIHADTALVGASHDDDACPADPGCDSGSAYVFERSGSIWGEQAKLTASDAAADDRLGRAVALGDGTALVGAYLDDDHGTSSGSAYLYARSGTTWSQKAKLSASDAEADDTFGGSVALDGDTGMVGASGGGELGGIHPGLAYAFAWCTSSQPSSETPRMGIPANPNAFLPGLTSGPILGETWDPVVDHTSFATSAIADFVGVDVEHGPQNIPTAWGMLLIWPPPNSQLFYKLAGAPFSIPVPNDCAYIGRTVYSQGGSYSPGGMVELANGLDLVLGTH